MLSLSLRSTRTHVREANARPRLLSGEFRRGDENGLIRCSNSIPAAAPKNCLIN